MRTEISYTDLKRYCDLAAITYQEFGGIVDPTGRVSWNTIYQVITGRSQNPEKRTRKALNDFIRGNRGKILSVLGRDSGQERTTMRTSDADVAGISARQ